MSAEINKLCQINFLAGIQNLCHNCCTWLCSSSSLKVCSLGRGKRNSARFEIFCFSFFFSSWRLHFYIFQKVTWKYSVFLGPDGSITILGKLPVCWGRWVTAIPHISRSASQMKATPDLFALHLFTNTGSSASSTLQQTPGKRYPWHTSSTSAFLPQNPTGLMVLLPSLGKAISQTAASTASRKDPQDG